MARFCHVREANRGLTLAFGAKNYVLCLCHAPKKMAECSEQHSRPRPLAKVICWHMYTRLRGNYCHSLDLSPTINMGLHAISALACNSPKRSTCSSFTLQTVERCIQSNPFITNSIVRQKVVIISVVSYIWTRSLKSSKVKPTEAVVSSYNSAALWSKNQIFSLIFVPSAFPHLAADFH